MSNTCHQHEGEIEAGIGLAKDAYETLLFSLCRSGCTISKLKLNRGMLITQIQYTAEGTEDQIALFQKEISADNSIERNWGE